MRNISYTQMRAELSDILDAIRNGETVVVTQRGRPDTVLSGSLAESGREPHGNGVSGCQKNPRTYTITGESRSENGKVFHAKSSDGMPKNWQQVQAKRSSEFKTSTSDGRGVAKSSFKDALNKTKVKHAKIIKALEDK